MIIIISCVCAVVEKRGKKGGGGGGVEFKHTFYISTHITYEHNKI